MKQSRNTAGVWRPASRHGITVLSLALGALMVFALLAGQAQPASAQYPVLPTETPAPATATRASSQYPVLPTAAPATATPVPQPPTATPMPIPPTATLPAAAPTTPPVTQPTAAPAAPTKPAAQPTADAPAAAGNPTATPAAVSAPMAATTTTGGPAASVPGEGPVQAALRAMLTGLGTLWLLLGVFAFVLALLGIGYLFKNRGGDN